MTQTLEYKTSETSFISTYVGSQDFWLGV